MKVSICTVTYNHESFIAQAIEGVLMQKTNFLVEMIIGEDCSSDNTREIVRQYMNNYPHIIKPIFHEKNVGGAENSMRCLHACTGEYIAALEGDDYWTDPFKLQKQVDFLSNNADFSMCYHAVDVIDFATNTLLDVWPNSPIDVSTVEDLARGNYIPTVSCLFRNRIKETLPAWFAEAPVGDYSLHMINAKYGKVKYLPDNMAVYRRHSQGVWAGADIKTTYSRLFKTIDYIKREFKDDDKYAGVMEKLQLHQFSLVGKLLDQIDADSRRDFLSNYSDEVSDMIVGAWEKIYANNVALQSRGAKLGIGLAQKLRRLLS